MNPHHLGLVQRIGTFTAVMAARAVLLFVGALRTMLALGVSWQCMLQIIAGV